MTLATIDNPAAFVPVEAKLPNGEIVYEINRYETKFLYKEIFVDKVYLRNGIDLNPDAVIFDVGANIGLFSLFCMREAPGARIVAFDPAPHCAACFRKNVSDRFDGVELIEAALLDKAGRQRFTYYPHYSIMSGLMADPSVDAATLRKGALNQYGAEELDDRARAMIETLADKKLDAPVAFDCEGLTVSDVVRSRGIERIDLLKVDVEKAEGMVIGGIEEGDWPKIRQVILEVHDQGAAEHEAMRTLLTNKGFEVVMEKSDDLSASDLYNIYARRPS